LAARQLLDNSNSQIGPLVKDLRETSDETDKTMAEARTVLIRVQQVLDPDAPLAVHINETLASLNQTAQSMTDLADYLQRNPSAPIRGRYVSDTGE
jgi:paraquat-inducible protein B